jgi:5-methyltetrahydropteroyltriglutamate--homocysteine methyltransferase
MLYTQVGRANIDPGCTRIRRLRRGRGGAYRGIADLYAAGLRYLQLDDVSLAYLCDEEMRARGRANGDDPDAQLALSVKLVRATLRDKPPDLAVCTHLCRGNFRSAWRAQGGYAGIAETIFNQMPYDGFFLEFDDARSGDFSPLRHVPRHVRVVLGLVTSKVSALEKKDDLRRRLGKRRNISARPALRQPQCGFSSTVEGNDVTVEDERAKLSLCVGLARDVWGGL